MSKHKSEDYKITTVKYYLNLKKKLEKFYKKIYKYNLNKIIS